MQKTTGDSDGKLRRETTAGDVDGRFRREKPTGNFDGSLRRETPGTGGQGEGKTGDIDGSEFGFRIGLVPD
jgi:hypothetical protein